MQPWGEMQEEALEAVSALGMSLISYDSTVAREDTKEDTSAEAIIEKIFGQRQYALHRGQILYCRMDYFEKGDHILGSLLLELEKERNIYPIVDVLSILENEEYLYQYPLPEEDILKGVKDRIHSGQLDGDLMEYVEKYYIGNVNINYSEKLPGFSAQELARIDMKGNIHNEERAVFLTFDDWGTDAAIEKLLSVLEKHDVKATFYVRTNYVAGNTNLLRAIAMEGHEIASHTHEHIPISIQTDQEKDVYRDLTDEEAQVLQKDLIQSYNVLQSIVGDVLLEDGRPALSTTFRPPTLAVGRKGMEVVFDSGFTYIVNGDYTTKDYLADDAQTLYRQLKSSIRNGSVVIMHMSDNSVYTAEALDLFLTENAQKAPHEQFVFRRVCDYLDGTYENE
jgi:peptidoglycan/xylan/chitin deacetylase (PgdA/CDA1 family)